MIARNPKAILATAADHYKLTMEEVLDPPHGSRVGAGARQVAAIVMRKALGLSNAEIAQVFGRKRGAYWVSTLITYGETNPGRRSLAQKFIGELESAEP